MGTEILQQDIQSLLEMFSKNMYKAKECENGTMGYEIMEKCKNLIKLDYSCVEIGNTSGELSSHYPSQIVIPEYELQNNSNLNGFTSSAASSQRAQNTIYESSYDANKLRDMINKARFARCRARFPLPVIMYKGKYICRSATLSGGPEIYGRSGLDYFFFGMDSAKGTGDDCATESEVYEAQEHSLIDDTMQDEMKDKNCEWQLFDRVRSQDIKLLKILNVGTIVDLMVEKKKVKFGMNVTSSEKVDKENRYAEFKIVSLPYPGCEFFREYRDNNYTGQGLVFDWSQTHVDANIVVPNDPVTSQLRIDWENYKIWDLVKITQNYLKLLLKYLQDNSSGLLVHCISGWDRTPLFISLLRLSLWADGVIHQTLNATQILYLTIAYDWYLFGHNLPDRITKGEEIFFFCFYVLKYLLDDDFCILGQRYKSKHSSGSSSIGVLRTDSECMLDGILFDGESQGSSVSLNSTCSCASTKSNQEGCVLAVTQCQDELINGNTNWLAHSNDSNSSIGCISAPLEGAALGSFNGQVAWSPQPKRTSPVSVPLSSRLRQRHESSSSLSVGSWQMISGTGSLRSSDSNCAEQSVQHPTLLNIPFNMFSLNANQASQESSCCTIIDDDCFSSMFSNDVCFLRKDRLNAVRSLFYHCYCSTIGFKFKNGPDSALGTLLGNFAEKVGLAQRTTV